MELDKMDIKILSLLQEDARRSFRDIAKELDISTPTVSSKISALEEMGVIRGYRADIDADSLGELTYVLIVKCSPSDLQEVSERLATHENVMEVFHLSNSRIFLKVCMLNPLDMNNFLSDLASIKEITEYDQYSVIGTVKEHPRAIIQDNVCVILKCYYCSKGMKDPPVKLKLDGKTHYVCCNTCAKHYKIKYEELKRKV